jgi:ubiquinone/menaquinone biosynthesis C-methylase UbiE
MDSYGKLKAGMRWMWSLGDYAPLAARLEPHAEALAAACDIRPGARVLDVGAGSGNFALAAARRGAEVTASDLSPRMLELGAARSSAEGLPVTWVEADAEGLPFPDASFDVVASVFGAMFAPRPVLVASELMRVAGPGRLVAMANYGGDGFLAAMAALVSRYSSSSPVDIPSPFLWGDEDELRRRFREASSIEIRPRTLDFQFASFAGWLYFWERTNVAQLAIKPMLTAERYGQLVEEARRLIRGLNRGGDDGVRLESAYVQVFARP